MSIVHRCGRCNTSRPPSATNDWVPGLRIANKPLDDNVKPSSTITLENHLLSDPLVRLINWKVLPRSAEEVSKAIWTVLTQDIEPTRFNWWNSLEPVPVMASESGDLIAWVAHLRSPADRLGGDDKELFFVCYVSRVSVALLFFSQMSSRAVVNP